MLIVDLSLTYRRGMRGFDSAPHSYLEVKGYNTTDLSIYSHAGTHMDAPLHFLEGGDTIDKLPPEKCVGEALVIDLSHLPPRSLITAADLGPATEKIGRGSRVLLRTDWDSHVELEDYRTGFQRISIELAEWFVDQGVWLVGVQSPSVASLQDMEELTQVHCILLENEIVIVESLANLHLLPPEVYFIALPLKIAGCDGSPVRAIAIVD